MMDRRRPGRSRGTDALLVLVAGTARSGSTVTDLALGSGPRAFSCGEVSAWFRPWRPHHLDFRCNCGDAHCERWVRTARARPSRFHRAVVDDLDVDVVVDSSKTFSWAVDSTRWARRNDMKAAMVIAWKEPKDLAFSFFKRSRRPASIDAAMRSFAFHYAAYLALDVPKVAVRNEDLRDRPAATVASLCTVLGIDHESDQHEFWRHEHHHLFGSSSASEQVQTGASTPEDSVTIEFEERWMARGMEQDRTVQQLSDALRTIDTSVIDEPVRGPVGPNPLSGPRLAVTYSKQRLIGAARRTSLHVRTRRLRRTYP
jgi:hypothetical protein